MWAACPEVDMTAKTEPAADPVKAADAAKAVLRIRKTLARMLSESEGERTAAANAFHRMAAANGWRPDEILILPPQPGGPNIMDLESHGTVMIPCIPIKKTSGCVECTR